MATNQQLQTMIRQLKTAGYVLEDIAGQCGCSVPAIHRIKQGQTKRPRHDIAEGIVRMHKMRLPQLDESQCQPT